MRIGKLGCRYYLLFFLKGYIVHVCYLAPKSLILEGSLKYQDLRLWGYFVLSSQGSVLPELRSVRRSRVLSLSVMGSFGQHLIIVLNWVLMSFFSRLMSTFSFLILLFRKVLWHIIQIKSEIWQSVSSDLMAFGGLLVDSMQFDALISQFSSFKSDCISCNMYCT